MRKERKRKGLRKTSELSYYKKEAKTTTTTSKTTTTTTKPHTQITVGKMQTIFYIYSGWTLITE